MVFILLLQAVVLFGEIFVVLRKGIFTEKNKVNTGISITVCGGIFIEAYAGIFSRPCNEIFIQTYIWDFLFLQ